MITTMIRLSLVLLVLNLALPSTEAYKYFTGTGTNDYVVGYRDRSQPKTLARTSYSFPSLNGTRKGLGISAWGIVLAVVALVLAGMGLYYFSICYHICQPTTKKYDKMMLPTIA